MKLILLLIGVLVMSTDVAATVSVKAENDTTIRRVLILGNSITIYSPAPQIGWYGDWGMAAGSKDKDFVHILDKSLSI